MFDFDVRDHQDPYEGPSLSARPLHVFFAEELADSIEGVARRPALILPPTSHLSDALEKLTETDRGMALIASHGYLLGTLTEKQILRRLARQPEDAWTTPVWKIMRVEPETLSDSDSVGYALEKLRQLELPAMPVLHPTGMLLGLLECRDVLAWINARLSGKSCDFVGHG